MPSLALLSKSRLPAKEVNATGAGDSCSDVADDERERARTTGVGEEADPEHIEEIREVLNKGTYLNGCNLPAEATVELCVAVIDGEARGVTVSVKGGEVSQAICIADQVRALEFPEHDLVSIARTTFAGGGN